MGTDLFPAERDCDKGVDRISELPDDILINFVSRMEMKEAAKTSSLSKQWRYLWAKSTHLNFNHLVVVPDLECRYLPHPDQQKKYINWVNQVVDLHCSPYINTFRVCFAFQRRDAHHHIDKWVRFAISKKVKNLELDLRSLCPFYTLTFDVLKPSLDINDSGIRFLQSLYLTDVNVSGDILEYLLVQCHGLERLHVVWSRTLVRLKVVGLCLKLKHLTLLYCCNLEQVNIEAVNLVYLRCSSNGMYHRSNALFKSIPNLVEARFDANCVSDFASLFQLNSHLAQISKLSLAMEDCESSAGSLPNFCNLKQLTVIVGNAFDSKLAPINQLLKACPKLHEFKFGYSDDRLLDEAYQLKVLKETEMMQDWEYFESMHEMELDPTGHPNLKEIQVVRFCGWDLDVDLILFLVLVSRNLETIICDCSCHCDTLVPEVIEVFRSRAAKLAKLIPPKISLSIM